MHVQQARTIGETCQPWGSLSVFISHKTGFVTDADPPLLKRLANCPCLLSVQPVTAKVRSAVRVLYMSVCPYVYVHIVWISGVCMHVCEEYHNLRIFCVQKFSCE